MANDEVELMPAPIPQRNFQMKEKRMKSSLSSTKSSMPKPIIETIYRNLYEIEVMDLQQGCNQGSYLWIFRFDRGIYLSKTTRIWMSQLESYINLLIRDNFSPQDFWILTPWEIQCKSHLSLSTWLRADKTVLLMKNLHLIASLWCIDKSRLCYPFTLIYIHFVMYPS